MNPPPSGFWQRTSSAGAFTPDQSDGQSRLCVSSRSSRQAARLVVGAMEKVRDMTGSIANATAEQSRGAALIMQATDSMRNASRQVSKATDEQASTSQQISGAVDNVSARSQQISKSLLETKKNSQNILNSVEGVKNIPEENRKLAFRINKMLWDLQKDAELLKAELERFKLHGS